MDAVSLMVKYWGEWVCTQDNKMRYVGGERKMIIVNADMTYKALIVLLCKRLRIDHKRYRIVVKINLDIPNNDLPYEISDDEDVLGMMIISLRATDPKPFEIYLTLTENVSRDSAEDSFMLLPEYCYNLKLHNPGTVTHIETDAENRFDFFFMALGCSIRAFRQHIRPVICIDGAFLRDKYMGTLFIAVGKDGNNQIYPLAFGIGPKEDKRTWALFLSKIKECLGEMSDLVILSDRHTGIIKAIKEVFPHVHHGCCCQYLKTHMKSTFKDINAIVGLYWKAAKAYRRSNFCQAFKMLRKVSPDAAEHLTQIGVERWARSYFLGLRYNIMTTNIEESFTALVKKAHGLPITLLVEFIRGTLQRWFQKRRSDADANPNTLTKWAEGKVAGHVRKSANFVVYPINNQVYEVHGVRHKEAFVNLEERTCSCRKFDLSQIPCMHVVAVARVMQLSNCYQWVHPYYTNATLRAVYSENVMPLGDQSEWIRPKNLPVIRPPIMQCTRAGRPIGHNRIPSRGEEVLEHRCSRC